MERSVSSLDELADRNVESWDDIHAVLDGFQAQDGVTPEWGAPSLAGGIAFLTFDYGVDGVTIEIAKYASCLEQALRDRGFEPIIHCIGGEFHDSADQVLAERWRRKRIDQANGWSKWHGGVWFDRMFRAEMSAGSVESREIAQEVWRQAVGFARELAEFLVQSRAGLLIPVNVNSNPGNPALALAAVLASETLGIPVINSCHDFFWESGAPASERKAGESPGTRDHFFRNHTNVSFFRFIERIHPWNGSRWLTLVINTLQRAELIRRANTELSRIIEIGTYVEDEFFVPITAERKVELRRRLGYIMAHGERVVSIKLVEEFEARIPDWMKDQRPVVCGAETGLSFDLTDLHALWFLQPTRIVPRKRIPRDWDLIESLFQYMPFRLMFEENPELTLTLHVTGPVPAEHEEDLRDIVTAFKRVLSSLPDHIGQRVYLALSAGKLGHSTFQRRALNHLSIADLYHLADLVALPSATEARGLPILEAAAAGLPLICSRYHPQEVFEAVIGHDLEERGRIQYLHFPEGRIGTALLQEITDLVFLPAASSSLRLHNRRAMAARYSKRELTRSFGVVLDMIAGHDAGTD
ncbi:MAG: glycosyltransferase [Planctomycetota bacterium]